MPNDRSVPASTRTRLLDAALDLLLDADVDQLLGTATSVRSVTDRAGTASGALYHWWPDRRAFLRELAEGLFDPASMPRRPDPAMRSAVIGAATAKTSPEPVRAIVQAAFELTTTDRTLPLRLCLMGATGDRPVREQVGRYLDVMLDETELLLAGLNEALDRGPRPPATNRATAATFVALVHGAALLHQHRPEDFDSELVVDAVISVLSVMTTTASDRRSITQRARELFMPTTVPPPPSVVGRRRGARTKVARSRTVVVSAASELFHRNGDDEVTVRAIASEAGVSEATVYKLFGTRDGVAAAVFADRVVAGAAELPTWKPPAPRLRAVMAVVAEEAIRSPRLALAYAHTVLAEGLGAVPADYDRVALSAPLTAVAEVLESGQREHVVAPDLDVTRAARSCVLDIVGTALVDGDDDAHRVVGPTLSRIVLAPAGPPGGDPVP